MKKYFINSVDTRLRPALESMSREQLINYAESLVRVVLEVNRLENNRIIRTRNLKSREVKSKVHTITLNKLKQLFL